MDPITGYIISIIISVLLSAASTLLKQAGSVEKTAAGTRGQAQIGGKVPQYFLMGTVAEPGKREYRNTWGAAGGVPNAYLVDVHSFGDLPLTAMTRLYINGTAETVASSGKVTQGFPTTGDKAGLFWAEFFDGSQTTASSYLTGKFGSDADRPWLADMIGRGVPHLVTTALWDQERWTGFPSIVAEFQGIRLYDPRKDSTKGGSGPQRWAGAVPTPAEQATWAFSDNNAVMIYNIERGIYYQGAHVWGGRKTANELPYAVWAAAMDKCDLAIPLASGGSEKQFRAGRRVDLDERPSDVIKELLVGANARISHASDGMVYILVGVPSVADGSFSDSDVLATEPIGSIPFPSLDDIINGATGTYREPAQAWEDKETAPYYRSDLEALDDDRRQVEGFGFGTIFSGTQAQRVLKAVVEEGRRFRRHVVGLPPEFAQYRPLQVLAWTNVRLGYSGKLFLITARTRTPFGTVVFGLQEIDPADHAWVPANDEKPLSFSPVVPARPAPQAVSGPSVAPVPGELAFDAFWSAASVAVDVDFVRISYRKPGENAEVVPVPKPPLLTGSARVSVPLSLGGTTIEVQLEYIALSGRPMIASAWMPVAIADVRILPDDLSEELQDTIEGVNDWLDVGLPALTDAVEGIDAELAAVQTSVAANFQQVNDALSIVEAQVADLTGVAEHVQADAYDEDDIVQSGGSLYRAKIAVPANTAITNTTYWEKIGDYASLGEAVAGTANLLTSEVARLDGAISSQSGSITALQNALPGKADASAVSALSTRVTGTENTNTSQGSAITSLQNALPGKADASALTALTTRVTDAENVNSAQGTAITGVQAAVGNQDADANWVKNAMFQAAGELNPVTGTAFTVSFLAATDPSVPAGAPAERVGVLDLLQTPASNALRSHTFLTKNASSYVPLTPGEKIVLSVDVCVINPVGIHQFLMFTRRNASGSATNDRAVRYDAVLGGWQKLVFAYTVPASGVVEARLAVGMDPGPTADRPGAGTKLFFANPVFQKLQAGAAVQAAAQTALDARTTANETAISSTSSALTSLSNVVNDPVSGLAGKVSTAVTDSLAASIQSTTDKLVSRTHDIRRMQNTAASSALLNLMQIGANVETMEATRTEITVTKDGVQAVAERVQSMEAVVGGNLATSLQQIQLLADESSARGTQIDQLRAVVGDSGAEVLIKGEVVSGPGGPGSRYAIRLQTTSNGEVLGSGVFFIDIATDGASTIGLQASRTVFYTSDGQPFALLNDDKKFRSANGAFEVDMSTGDVTMTRGVIRSDDGKFQINPALKTISIST